jgi:hypothetical protein
MNEQERITGLAQLREPFPPGAIGKLPRKTKDHGTIQLDFVGHANVTARLLNIDPLWEWEPVACDNQGLPALIRNQDGFPIGLWIKLTVCGVTRYGFGSCEANKFDPIKELIGDAIRNAAMRFGVALDLWTKEELEAVKDSGADTDNEARTEGNVPSGKTTEQEGVSGEAVSAPEVPPSEPQATVNNQPLVDELHKKFGPSVLLPIRQVCKDEGVNVPLSLEEAAKLDERILQLAATLAAADKRVPA